MVVTQKGEPAEIDVRPGSKNDVSFLGRMNLDLPPNAILYADGAYTSYDLGRHSEGRGTDSTTR